MKNLGLDIGVGVPKDGVVDDVVFTIANQTEEEQQPHTTSSPIIVRFENQLPQQQQLQQQLPQVRQLQHRQLIRQIGSAEELPSPIPMRIQVPKSMLEAGQTILMRRPDGTLVQVVVQRQQQQQLQRQIMHQPKPVRPVRTSFYSIQGSAGFRVASWIEAY